MPIGEDDLDAASTAGMITASQADALRAFATERQRRRLASLSHEERFRFMRGFNDFFFAVGIALFGGGMAYFAARSAGGNLLAAVIIWVLAEFLVARMRLVLPGILLAGFFVFFAAMATPVDLLFKSLAGAAWAAAFYARFRLPFSLLLLAGCLVIAVNTIANSFWSTPSARINSPVLLVCGLLVFAAAMAFDLSDRERTTRRADCAFWLHLLGSPLIVHSLISLVTPNAYEMTTPVAIAILVIFAALVIVAVVIDRRALLVSALMYIGIVIAYGIRTVGVESNQVSVLFTTLLIIGSVVLVIAVGWQPLRRLLLAPLPASLRSSLPGTGISWEG